MKIALAQLNYHIANFDDNTKKIKDNIEKARSKGADLVIFSEMAVCGYPPNDLLEQKDFIDKCETAIDNIAKSCVGIAAIVGSPRINPNSKGKQLYNSAYFLYNGEIQSIHNKTLLPTYDIFDEYRYFEPNTEFNVVEYKGKKIAITICEDLWENQPVDNVFEKNQLYTLSPMHKLKPYNPDFVVNIAASPFSYSHDHIRKTVLTSNARQYRVPIIYVNQVGAQTELIFDGGSMIVNQNGQVIGELKYFESDFQIVEYQKIKQKELISIGLQPELMTIERIHNALVLGVSDFFKKLGFTKATLGLSGGIDSAITAVIAVRALGNKNVRVLLMPSKYSSQHSITDAEQLAKNLDIQYDIIDIQNVVDEFQTLLKPIFGDLPPDITEENIQARARGVLLMALSNKMGHILLNTSNKSEAAVGYGTLYGDMAGGLSVLGDVYKTNIYKLARFINRNGEVIPENTIVKPPSAELSPDQKDTDSLPAYEILDDILRQYIEHKKSESEIIANGHEPDTVRRMIQLVNRTEFKRFQAPPILRITTKSFGVGRRMPLVAKY